MPLKKLILLAVLPCVVAHAAANQNNCEVFGHQNGGTYYGKTDCQNVTLASLSVYGDFTFNKATINGNAMVHGNMYGDTISIKKLFSVHGNATVSHLQADDLTQIHGRLDAKQSILATTQIFGTLATNGTTINGPLTLNSTFASLNNTKTKSITVNSYSTNITPIICLSGSSTVNGNITFNNARGKIYLADKAQIIGKVFDGVSNYQPCPN